MARVEEERGLIGLFALEDRKVEEWAVAVDWCRDRIKARAPEICMRGYLWYNMDKRSDRERVACGLLWWFTL